MENSRNMVTSRPCSCNCCEIGKAWDKSQCRRCWLFHNDQRYHSLWGGTSPPPSTLTKAVTFAKAVVWHAVDGFSRVTNDQHIERLAICGFDKPDDQRCPQFNGVNTCQACGCGLRVKALWRSETCPLGKWPSLAILPPAG